MRGYGDITLKYLKKNKKRSLFTIIGIILSLSLISGVGFLGLSFKEFMYNNTIKNSGDYEFSAYGVSKEQANTLKNDVDLEKIAILSNLGNYTTENNSEVDINITAQDRGAFEEVFSNKLEEGRYPENSSELVLNINAKKSLGLKIGDKIEIVETEYKDSGQKVLTNNKVEYEIVGFEKDQYIGATTYFNGTTYLENEHNLAEYSVLFSVITNKDKHNIALNKILDLNISSENLNVNNELLALKGQTTYKGINVFINLIVLFVLTVIVIATIFLIYNAINISVTERMTQFGILRSIGATPSQVKSIVIREGFVMCILSIPLGILFGYIGVWVTLTLLKNQIATMFSGEILNIKFYPVIIIFTAILGIITILMASFGPSRRAAKVSPIEIVKGNSGEDKIKYYSGKLIRTMFGVEGWIAYKNIRKNSKRFIVTILSLSISLIMFITFTTLNMKRIDELKYIQKNTLSHGTLYADEKFNEVANRLSKIQGVGEVYVTLKKNIEHLGLDLSLLTDEYRDFDSYTTEDRYFKNSSIEAYNDEVLKTIGINEGLDKNEIVILNGVARYNSEGKLENIEKTTLREGDTIKLPVSNFSEGYGQELATAIENDKLENNFIELKVKKVVDKGPFDAFGYSSTLIIMNQDYLKELLNGSYSSKDISFRYTNINDEDLVNNASKEIEAIADEYGITFINLDALNKRQEQMWTVVNVFIYGFIVMISLIGVVNVINTISLNILLKKKEFGTLGTIGMDRGQLTKMIMLEGVLHGIISSVIGGILSIGLALVAVKIVSYGFSFSSSLYWQPFVIGFIINLGVVLIASIIPLSKIKKMSLVETIRNVE